MLSNILVPCPFLVYVVYICINNSKIYYNEEDFVFIGHVADNVLW